MSTNTGHTVYDTTLERFVTGIHPTAAKAKEAAGEAPEGHTYEARHITEANPTGAKADKADKADDTPAS